MTPFAEPFPMQMVPLVRPYSHTLPIDHATEYCLVVKAWHGWPDRAPLERSSAWCSQGTPDA